MPLIAGVNIVELDPLEDSVGYGGLPNADGIVQLDSCCMHGPKKRAGGVGAIEGVKTPSLVAKAVMEHTDHHLVVGRAPSSSRAQWASRWSPTSTRKIRARNGCKWKQHSDPLHYIKDPESARRRCADHLMTWSRPASRRDHLYGTINCNGVNANGDICGVTTTSGLAWKIPGRLGDSPILGAGLYVDSAVGAAGSTAAAKPTCTACARS